MNNNVRIILAGPRGKMGREAVDLISNTSHFTFVAALDHRYGGSSLKDIEGMPSLDVPVYGEADTCFSEVEADVLIDLTTPDVGRVHMDKALDHYIRPVIGTTGFSDEDIERIRAKAEEKALGAIIAPNFAVGAILMMKFSQMAAKYFQDVEIIEKHHDQKLDAPSGTAVKTAKLIDEVREKKAQGHPEEKEELAGARGADYEGMHIHSMRLPGLIAHQEVVFGGEGQTLTIQHDSMNRASFMPGVRLAVDAVMQLDTLVYGLENVME
ncbi:dihydrodipicolinate reductase [Salsuginibacillus halophilus]|uniref:4-hydroxy-tetrahydrodipicolinate reductase n=1 Tax=Salsuginibacillus halophilus TaxID=517424 RepID=A0A2P8HWH8_9BACI|nr:4-hydroxy-tetrahydrodipicolinate reductase [Salsuginibacillus halophilus]PSL50525.1 dihydrodipicolinate reductase [Salsuginibacillus halophilus]